MSGGQQAAAGTAAGRRIAITAQSISDSVAGSIASASYTLGSNGQASYTRLNGSSGNISAEWTAPTFTGIGAGYEVRATVQSGSVSSGTTGSWISMSSPQSWVCTQSVAGTKAAQLLIEIRIASSATVASAVINLSATRS